MIPNEQTLWMFSTLWRLMSDILFDYYIFGMRRFSKNKIIPKIPGSTVYGIAFMFSGSKFSRIWGHPPAKLFEREFWHYGFGIHLYEAAHIGEIISMRV